MKQGYFNKMLSCDKSYRNAFILALLLPVAALICGIIVGMNSEFFSHFFPPCTFKLLTGFNCLSCGATRSTISLLHGHPLTAIYYNPLYFVFLCWLLYLYLRLVISLIRRPYHKYSLHLSVPWGIATVIAAISFFIIRNTDFYQAIFY